jgi:hypothetical protein
VSEDSLSEGTFTECILTVPGHGAVVALVGGLVLIDGGGLPARTEPWSAAKPGDIVAIAVLTSMAAAAGSSTAMAEAAGFSTAGSLASMVALVMSLIEGLAGCGCAAGTSS